jgi:hypothetical protein
MGVLAIRLPSESIFSFELSVYSVFGIPLTVSLAGLAMDVDRQYSLVKALDGDKDRPKQFFLQSGINGSALEHSVPEQLWSTPTEPAYGISAVKALKIANDQGIPIYTINQTNIDTILPQLQIDEDAKTDIRNAVSAGKEVTVSKTNITYNGWTGCGYIIIDPDTGAGAYMISGGMSGGVLAMYFGAFLMIVGLFTVTTTGPMAPIGFLMILAGSVAFAEGLKMYLGEITDVEFEYFKCMLPVLISGLFGAILSLYGGLYIRELFLTAFDVISTYNSIKDVFDCIEILLQA